MLKEVLIIVLTALPNWMALALMGLNRQHRAARTQASNLRALPVPLQYS